MPGVYNYVIKRGKEGYYFCLYPNNNYSNNNYIGRSTEYTSAQECHQALIRFKNLILSDKLYPDDASHAKMEKTKDGKFFFAFYDNEKKVFYRDIGYGQKVNCIKGINNVIKHRDAEIR